MEDREKEKLRQEWERVQREMRDNPRTALQCAARGCDGCSVCQPIASREAGKEE